MYEDLREELCSLYYIEKCGLNLEKDKIDDLKNNQPYNFELIDALEKAQAEAEEKDPTTGEAVNIMHRVYTQMSDEAHKIQFNNNYLFIHNNHVIYYFDINKHFEHENRKKINL